MYESIPDVMSVKDAASILGVGSGAIYNDIKLNRLRSVKVGRKLLIPKHCFLEYIGYETNQASNSELNLTVIEGS